MAMRALWAAAAFTEPQISAKPLLIGLSWGAPRARRLRESVGDG